MAEIWTDCAEFVGRHICKCLIGIIAAGLALASTLMLTVQELSISVATTELLARTTATTLDMNTEDQQTANQAILKELGTLSTNVAVLADRSKRDDDRSAGPPPSLFVPRIAAGEPTP